MTDEMTLLLVGAGIALVSSLLTGLVAAFTSYTFERRKHREELVEKVFYLGGKHVQIDFNVAKLEENILGEASKGPREFQEYFKELQESVKGADTNELSGVVGILEAYIIDVNNRIETIKTQRREES